MDGSLNDITEKNDILDISINDNSSNYLDNSDNYLDKSDNYNENMIYSNEKNINIEHIVFSGGGPIGFIACGCLKELTENNILKKNNIKSIYATSIGVIVALLYLLDIKYEFLYDFLIKRPWNKLFAIDHNNLMKLFYTNGIFTNETIKDVIRQLLLVKNLTLDATLLDLYNITNINLTMVVSNINDFKKELLNHKSHPKIKLYDAIHATCAVPILFESCIIDNKHYIDGGLFSNTPLKECLKIEKCKKKNVLVFENTKENMGIDYSKILIEIFTDISENKKTSGLLEDEEKNNFELLYKEFTEKISNLDNSYDDISNNYNNTNNNIDNFNVLSFMIYIIKKIFIKIMKDKKGNIVNDYSINLAITKELIDLNFWYKVCCSENMRRCLLKIGENKAKDFIHQQMFL